jgi:5-methylcytosine-specific restriction endonuclease McrA
MRAVKQGLQSIFERRSGDVYSAMAKRIRRKLGGELPFTLAEYRGWLLERFAGSWDNAVQCAYCTAWLNASTFETDHREPLKFGGGIGLDNLDLVCANCNRLKGSMSARGFRLLLEFAVLNLHAQDANEMFARMKNGGAYLRTRFMAYPKKPPRRASFR